MFDFSPTSAAKYLERERYDQQNGMEKKDSIFDDLGLSLSDKIKKEVKANHDNATDFMKLLLTQMQNQNPLDPQDGTEFLGQLAQFNAVETNQKMLDSMNKMVESFESKRIIDATTLIGRSIEYGTNKFNLSENRPVKGTIQIAESVSDFNISIFNSEGAMVRYFTMGKQEVGSMNFSWDGLDSDGVRLPDGIYRIHPEGIAGDEIKVFNTVLDTYIDNVTVNRAQGTVKLNLSGVGEINLDEVTKISK